MFIHSQSGLYLTLNRAYDPYSGRWLSRDPIGESGGINLYGYAGQEPVNRTDPSGRFGLPGLVIGVVAGGIAGYETGGWRGALIGGAVGGVIGIAAPEFSGAAAVYATGLLGSEAAGAVVGTATFSAVNGLAGGAGAIATNLLEGNPTFNDAGTGVVIGAVAPLLSGEAVVAGGLGGAAEAGLPPLADSLLSAQSGIFGVLGTTVDAGVNREGIFAPSGSSTSTGVGGCSQ
jgi:RHS repeat-associated protein